MKKNILILLIIIFYPSISFADEGEIKLIPLETYNKDNAVDSDNAKISKFDEKINSYVDKIYLSSKYDKQRKQLENVLEKLDKIGKSDKKEIVQKVIDALDKKQKDFLENEEIKRLEKLKPFYDTLGKILDFNGKLITRSEWGADESFGNPEKFLAKCSGNCWKKTSEVKMSQMDVNYVNNFKAIDKKIIHNVTADNGLLLQYYPVSRIIIHHTAMPLARTKNEGTNQMQSIYRYHALNLGWGDIGYNYLIDGEGNVYEGRTGGMHIMGAHVYGHNLGSVGISLMSSGEYTQKQLKSLKELVVYLAQEYKLDITQKAMLRNYMLDGESMQNVVVAHKELDRGKPVDPGINMDEFRSEVSQMFLK